MRINFINSNYFVNATPKTFNGRKKVVNKVAEPKIEKEPTLQTPATILAKSEDIRLNAANLQNKALDELQRAKEIKKEVLALYNKGKENDFETFTDGSRTISFVPDGRFYITMFEYTPEGHKLKRSSNFWLLDDTLKTITEHNLGLKNEYSFMDETGKVLKIKKGLIEGANGESSTKEEFSYGIRQDLRRYTTNKEITKEGKISTKDHYFFSDEKLLYYSNNQQDYKKGKRTVGFEYDYNRDNPETFSFRADLLRDKEGKLKEGRLYKFENGELIDYVDVRDLN